MNNNLYKNLLWFLRKQMKFILKIHFVFHYWIGNIIQLMSWQTRCTKDIFLSHWSQKISEKITIIEITNISTILWHHFNGGGVIQSNIQILKKPCWLWLKTRQNIYANIKVRATRKSLCVHVIVLSCRLD